MRFRRRRASRLPRPDWRASAEAPVLGAVWTRTEKGREIDRGRRALRLGAAALALVEGLMLGWLFAGQAFAVRHVEVSGAHRLDRSQVVAAAGLQRPGSVFALDAATIRRKLGAATWVRSASVSTELPDRVVIQVDEWQPVADYRAGAGPLYFVSDQGVALGPAAGAGGLLEIDGPPGAEPRAGHSVLEARLLTALVNIQRGLPTLLPGQEVRSFTLDGCGNVTMTARRGWQVQFGRVLTPEEYRMLDEKLAALRSISTRVDYNSPDLEYVNVMSPSAAAVKLKSAKPPPASPPSPQPKGATPAPTPAPIQAVPTCR